MKINFALLLAAVSAANIDAASETEIEVEIDEEPKALS